MDGRMDQQRNNRGRARGRASNQGQNVQRPGHERDRQWPAPSQQGRPGPSSHQQGSWGGQSSSSSGGAWGGQRPAPSPGGSAWGQPSFSNPSGQQWRSGQQPKPAAQGQSTQYGRATHRGGGGDAPGIEHKEHVQGGPSGDAGVVHSGRGAVRGGRSITTEYLKTRPDTLQSKKGSSGTPVSLKANYYKLLQKTSWCLYQHRIDFNPPEDRTPTRKGLLRTALRSICGGYIFDGTVLYTSRQLTKDSMDLFVNNEKDEKICITIKYTGDVAVGDYHYLQVFNLIMRKCMGFLKLQLVGRNFFDAVEKVSMSQHRMELWPGYVTSIRQHESDILMCVEITHKVMRNDTVGDLLAECRGREHSRFKQEFSDSIIGSVVLTDYNNRTYRIDDIDWDSTPASTFKKSDGSEISYVDYYKQRYNLRMSSNVYNQPMLVSRAKPREIRAGMSEIIYLVPELCRMTGLTDKQRSNFNLMKALAEHTRVGPVPRMAKLERFSNRLRNKPEIMEELKQWDMELSRNIIQLSGRILPPEKILAGMGNSYSAGPKVDWGQSLYSVPPYSTGRLERWVVMFSTYNRNSTQNFVQLMQRAARGMKWELPHPKYHELRDDHPGQFLPGLDSAIHSYSPELILCIASNNKQDRYNAIKKKCCVERAVPTQVVLARTINNKKAMSIATKVIVQLNCKLGGAPWSVEIPINGLMIVGYDVCHDPRQKNRSFGAIVASLDRGHSRYYGVFSAHTTGEEISNDFALNLLKACTKYREVQGAYPRKIVIYRDGVGDGQLPYIFEYEVDHIRKVLESKIYTDKKESPLQMAFIVVSKRINTRIFSDKGNPGPGTVVDDIITLPERYDFFIVSQCVREGTVAPTSYNILYDNLGYTADQLQRLTYKLTHMYYNWAGAVRVPAPCQYAHKLAFLAAQSLQRPANPELDTVLYYL